MGLTDTATNSVDADLFDPQQQALDILDLVRMNRQLAARNRILEGHNAHLEALSAQLQQAHLERDGSLGERSRAALQRAADRLHDAPTESDVASGDTGASPPAETRGS
jgi:hypothetical protein